MSQKAFMQSFDALAFGAFRAAGVADAATYTPPGAGAEPVPCTALLDEGVQNFTDEDPATVVARYDRVTLQLAEVTPRSSGIVVIEATGRRLKLEQKLRGDASAEQWEVSNV